MSATGAMALVGTVLTAARHVAPLISHWVPIGRQGTLPAVVLPFAKRRRCYRIVQPWGRDKARQATALSEHPTARAAFEAIDRIAARLATNGQDGDYLELLVVDQFDRIVPRPDVH